MTARVALITGASRGIGRELAAGLLAEGWVIIGVARSPVEEWALGAQERLERIVCDVSDESAVRRLFSHVRQTYGRLDLLINNAGAFSADLLVMASGQRFTQVLLANLVSVHLMTREAVKVMRPQTSGRVINISSIAPQVPLPGNALYAVSKRGVEEICRGFASEFRDTGITFNFIAISFFEGSGMLEALRPEARATYEARLLKPRPLPIAEILHGVRFLASDDSRSITAQGITLGSPL